MTVVHMTSRALACIRTKLHLGKVTLLRPAKLPGATGRMMPTSQSGEMMTRSNENESRIDSSP